MVEFTGETRDRVTFYIDVMMFVIVAISLVFLVLHSYNAGYAAGEGTYINAQQEMMYMAACVAFLAPSMTWIFIRFFKRR
ncbi:MAG: hypothetical protein DRN00_04470 [Thermoplasmata archaeon]|nr:MAG: hypothetical protein DRN00_04470 [Thermoplasmata archaeon]